MNFNHHSLTIIVHLYTLGKSLLVVRQPIANKIIVLKQHTLHYILIFRPSTGIWRHTLATEEAVG